MSSINILTPNTSDIPFERSFAAHEKSQYWSSKNGDINPRQVFMSSHTKFWFDCKECNHSFESSLNNITDKNNPRWCSYCKGNHKLCNDENCHYCFEKSFASHEKSQFWSSKNRDVNPRQVFMSSHTKFWFDCKECKHEFEITLNSVTNKTSPQWCPYCAVPSKKMCDNKSCNFCLAKSFAMHPKSQFWSSKNGELTPSQVFISSNKKYWFDCDKCGHEFESSLSNITNKTDPSWCPFCSIAPKQLCNNEDCQPCFERSFASHEKSKYWSSKNGDITPRIVSKHTNKKYWFDCDKCGHDFESSLNCIAHKNFPKWCPFCSNPPQKLCNNENCQQCFEKSFASHEKSKHWSSKNGDITPRQVFRGSENKYWFNCEKCNHEFEIRPNTVTHKNEPQWCPYCSNKKLCESNSCQICFDKTFASHPKSKYWSSKNGEVTPRQLFISSKKKCWFDCEKCNHSFESQLGDITSKNNPRWCPFCASPPKQLCNNENCQQCFEKSFASHPKSQFWSFKNGDKNPRQVFKGSENKYWFDCETCKNNFESMIYSITKKNNPQWCPHCVNKTETKLYDILIHNFPTIIRQFKQEWCKNILHLPFDFCILEHKIIIELDGPQHFRQISNWRPPEEQYQIDKYKESCANQNGYSVIRIVQDDIWSDKYDWLKELLSAIEQLKSSNEPKNIYLHRNNEYENY